ncbi:CutC family [Popillia japonica]|uniref:Copper homeostasis protein cutC homolog n=1 Tax=Popillia japonica TaxID=7064 RepID=A0AAW1K458_POPJA
MQDELDSVTYNHDRLKKDFMKRANEIRFKEEEIARLKNEVAKYSKSKEIVEARIKQVEEEKTEMAKYSKSKEIVEARIKQVEEEKTEMNIDREKLRQMIGNMSREIDLMKRQTDNDRRSLEHLTREKDIMNKNMVRQQAVSRDHVKLIKIQEQARRKLVSEIDTHIIEGNKKIKQICYLEKERDRLLEEQLNLTKKIEDYMDEAKLRKAEIYDLKKVLAEQENKLRMQLNLFDAVRAERNALQKNLQEANAESSELKTKLKVTSHQTEQLKEDIAMKEQQLIKEEIILRKVTKEKENLRVECDNGLEMIRNLKEELSELKAEEKRLHKVILNGDKLIRQQTKDLEQLLNERDILGSQLVRRNDELSLLYEKIKILQTTLHRGEAQYEQRLEDIRVLKVEIKRLRQEKNLLTKTISNMTDLRQEVFHLERDLTRERLKCKALEEELQNPMNIHRWRKLEGTDPELYELLQKMQLLQKRLLRQSSEAIERERQLKEAERLYLNLRQIVARQPGPELQDQLQKTQKALKVNTNKMKCLVSELNMSELQAKEYKAELAKVTNEMKELKRKFCDEKKSHAKRLAVLQESVSRLSIQYKPSDVKFAGGGYKIVYFQVRMPKTLEVCVDSFESAMAAIAGGAGRLELCSSLIEGGLTPTPGLLMQIQNANSNKIPVFCMLRCRSGNFIYTNEEIEIMKEDAKILRKNGADGFVFGALLENGDVDMKKSREVIKTCFPLPVTFHRAFDFCRRPTIEIEVIIDLGFTRILTSGQQKTAQLGVKLIKKLMEQVGTRIIIMPGGGINAENLKFVMESTEATEYHGSFKKAKAASNEASTDDDKEIVLGVKDSQLYVTDEQLVAQLVDILKNE